MNVRPIIALDLGTKTGVSLRFADGTVTGATWLLAKEKDLRVARMHGLDRSGDIRIPRLAVLLDDVIRMLEHGGRPLVVFEDVQFLSSQAQSQLWASFRTVLWMAAGSRKLETLPVPVGSLKKFATGHGNADKPMMAAHLLKSGEVYDSGADDNEVDARWLRRFAANWLDKAAGLVKGAGT